MKRITFCYVDGYGNEQIKHVSDERSGQVGYSVDELTARIWISGSTGEETKIFPLSRIVFIRQISQVV